MIWEQKETKILCLVSECWNCFSFLVWCFPTSSLRILMIHPMFWRTQIKILALWIVILLSVTQLNDNFTSCLLLVLFSDIIWLFHLVKLIVFQNSQHHFSWQHNDVGGGKWDFDELMKFYSFCCVLALTGRKMHIIQILWLKTERNHVDFAIEKYFRHIRNFIEVKHVACSSKGSTSALTVYM